MNGSHIHSDELYYGICYFSLFIFSIIRKYFPSKLSAFFLRQQNSLL